MAEHPRPALSANVLNKLPKSQHSKAKRALQEIWMAETKTRTGLCRHSNPSLFASGNSAGKGFGVARDRGGIFGDTGKLRAAETALSRVSGGKATES
jgi:hypothetical protein